ncbi:uncharacterized protein LOC114005927 [Tupaia chinensis]|nr:uncharacterized protein LOC114005927 [Tupaia chinensis]
MVKQFAVSSGSEKLFSSKSNAQFKMYKTPIFLNEVLVKLPTDPSSDEPVFHISHIDRVYTLRTDNINERSVPASCGLPEASQEAGRPLSYTPFSTAKSYQPCVLTSLNMHPARLWPPLISASLLSPRGAPTFRNGKSEPRSLLESCQGLPPVTVPVLGWFPRPRYAASLSPSLFPMSLPSSPTLPSHVPLCAQPLAWGPTCPAVIPVLMCIFFLDPWHLPGAWYSISNQELSRNSQLDPQ